MRLDLELLSIRFSQKKEEPPVPQDGISAYLLEKILMPALDSKDIYLKDVDFTAFDVDDIDKLEDYYNQLYSRGQGLDQFIQTVCLLYTSPSPRD